jgi:ABC-type multidrug transport system ATPase subunit
MTDEKASAPIHDPVVQTSSLTRKFGNFTAIDQVTLTINRGEIFGLIGPNGSGKSTLIKMLTTLLPPSSGSATIAGYDIISQPAEVRRHIGYVPQLRAPSRMTRTRGASRMKRSLMSPSDETEALRRASRPSKSPINRPFRV